ncbi:hypothetical protein AsFcp4_153 [Aeromonas phage AsFcp_4]|uniref:Uncharacterized protein n=1 Tax=Aeromonas phage PX29 TaxID=926067 RepID=E5DQQ5_9CAUD|nr:hypothetical protein CL89_gp155 [Aeromonas phage PX29]ADQ53041.1 conserved hypothetical protein [Aeromonas phage PX29]QAX98576.1 hypothetical protein ASfcp2_242 [Aeromonas phage AsFcp_2]QAX99607.1 hypothetical protein AsFcp4_153 [Aeromonas phage AsFcp_4]
MNNFVAKHAREFNVAAVMVDRKKQMKAAGTRKQKHKGRIDY